MEIIQAYENMSKEYFESLQKSSNLPVDEIKKIIKHKLIYKLAQEIFNIKELEINEYDDYNRYGDKSFVTKASVWVLSDHEVREFLWLKEQSKTFNLMTSYNLKNQNNG